MAKLDRGNVRWDSWLLPAVKAYGEKYNLGDFSKTVRFIVTATLNKAGYLEVDFTPNVDSAHFKSPKKKQKNFD